MSTELELISASGNFSFTEPGNEFLDVEEGRGMEPGDPKFTEKVWARSLLKTGATLALEALHEKELVFPLKLRGATKDQLTASIQKINRIITTSGCQVKWQDEGASKPTYFDLISGQLDDEYDFRLGQNNWLKCRLRLFVQPLGYYSPNGARAVQVSGVATTIKVGTMPIAKFVGATQLLGDAPALLQAQYRAIPLSTSKTYLAFSVLPASSYLPFLPCATMNEGLGSIKYFHDSVAPGGTYGHYSAPAPEVTLLKWTAPTENKGSYVGPQRLLMVARTPSLATLQPVTMSLVSTESSLGVATPAATSQWQLYDLGTLSMASSTLGAGVAYGMKITSASMSGASRAIDIAAVLQLPESSTCFVNTLGLNIGSMEGIGTFDGIGNAIRMNANIGVPASGVTPTVLFNMTDVTSLARGAIPAGIPNGQPPVVAVLACEPGNMNSGLNVNLNALEQTRYVF